MHADDAMIMASDYYMSESAEVWAIPLAQKKKKIHAKQN